ncbi:hypothetical protein QVD17_02259 [Tagetes erecta]|uniref:Transmembrane protein n=1 Tax=Tagetes erecta TaxID=13708 RepID=A0AAD8L921_TARER|nr:hypothetical protein QVD17_02259 [Tagetes erecta]
MGTSSSSSTTTTTIKIIRKSIHTFLKYYNFFTYTSLLALPFSTSILLSSSFFLDSIPFKNTIQFRLLSLFDAIAIPTSSDLFSIFTLKLSQTITSSILLLPFTFSSLLITKTSIIQHFNNQKPPLSFTRIFTSILQTQLWTSLLIISANTTSFGILFILFTCLEKTLKIFSSSTSIIILFSIMIMTYSIVIAHSMIICNMALIISGMGNKRAGFNSIVKACVIIKTRTTTALSLAIYINITLAAIETLFQFRVARLILYTNSSTTSYKPSLILVMLEGLLIAYLYSIIITLDTITSCIFYKSCKKFSGSKKVIDQEEGRIHGIEIKKEQQEL